MFVTQDSDFSSPANVKMEPISDIQKPAPKLLKYNTNDLNSCIQIELSKSLKN